MNRFLALLELGRIGEADDALAQYAGLIAELRQPWFDWHLLTVRATRAALDGDFARAADYAHGARQLELDADPGAVETWAAQTFMIGRGRGRFTEVDEEALRRCAERHEHRPLWRALGARLALGLGREHEARRAFATCVRAGLSDLAPDNEWLATVAMLAETAAGLGDRRNAATLLAALSPYAARTVVVCRGWATWGPVSSFLTRAEST
jgi:ATP/maltotriose-dependent transcriptional regulator MalT